MVKYIVLSTLTEKGLAVPAAEAPGVFSKTVEIAQAYGGTILQSYAITGPHDFVTVAEFPDAEAAFKAHTKTLELGLFRLESFEIFPIESFFAALEDTRTAVAV